jgi:hypothetical protein
VSKSTRAVSAKSKGQRGKRRSVTALVDDLGLAVDGPRGLSTVRIDDVATSHPDVPAGLDAEKLAEVALGLLSLTMHDGRRAWKTLDWGVMNLLHTRGWIEDPRGSAKSVVLTDAGLARAEKLLLKHFARRKK